MTDASLSTTPSGELFHRPKAEKGVNIQFVALLVTGVLHGLVFWWGINSAPVDNPPPDNIQAIRVFLQPLVLPESVSPRPPRILPVPAASPALPATPVISPSLTAPVSLPAPVILGAIPKPVVVGFPETDSGPEVAISVAPLHVAAAVVPASGPGAANTGATVSSSLSESRAINQATNLSTSSGGGPVGVVVSSRPVAHGAGGVTGSGKELYLRTVFAHIEDHKYYPPSARRRRLEGQVQVFFTIEPGGGVSDLKVSEGHPQLEEAALQAVRSALPLPLPADGVALPFKLSYRMDFRLR